MNCSKHPLADVTHKYRPDSVYVYCPWCWECKDWIEDSTIKKVAVSSKSTPTEPRRSKEKPEAKLVRLTIEALKPFGWATWRIGQHDVRGSGSDPGVPDLLVVHRDSTWIKPLYLLLEAKVKPNKPSADQVVLINYGVSRIFYTVEEAIDICQDYLKEIR